jgi:hypothetical protein
VTRPRRAPENKAEAPLRSKGKRDRKRAEGSREARGQRPTHRTAAGEREVLHWLLHSCAAHPACRRLKVMKQYLSAVSVLVPEYDQALAFYIGVLGFELCEDKQLSATKRWVTVAPPGAGAMGCRLLLARAATDTQRSAIGNQTGGRVFLFLATDDFDRDYARMLA